MATVDDLQKLQLVSKVCAELDNHLGLSDRTLAEFIIHLAYEHQNARSFNAALAANGAEFPSAFAESLFTLIKRMHQAGVAAKASAAAGPAPGLHIHFSSVWARAEPALVKLQ